MTRLAAIDRHGAALAAAGLVVFLLQGYGRGLGPDVALYAYAGQQLADGVPPYVAVLNRAGPLAHVVPGLGALAGRAMGIDELLGMRLLMTALSVACVWLAYLVGRDAFGTRLAGLVCGATLISMQGFVVYAAGGPREKTTMLLGVLLALWAVSRHRWVVAGVATALATLAWQPAFFPAAVATVVAASLLPTGRQTLRALAGFVVSGLLVLGATVGAFWAAGALPQFLEGFVMVHAGGYTRQTGVLVKPGRALVNVYGGFGWSTVPLGLGLVAMVVLGALRLRGSDRRSRVPAATVAAGAGTVAGLAWCGVAFQGWPDAMVLVPFAVLGVAGLAQALLTRLPGRRRTPVVLAVALALLLAAAVTSWAGRSAGLADQRRLAEAALAAAGPGATLETVGELTPLVLTERRNPSRYVNFTGGLHRYLDDRLPDGLAGLARDLERRRPTLVVTRGLEGPSFRWLRPTLRREFLLLGGDAEHGFWFVTRSAEPSRVAELRSVVEAAGVPSASAS